MEAIAWRARTIYPMAGERAAAGHELNAPLAKLDNGCIITRAGRIEWIGPWSSAPAGCIVRDLGDTVILPPLVNAHTHIMLSWLADKTLWGYGFAAWLRSMIPQITSFPGLADREGKKVFLAGLQRAMAEISASGTGIVGDVGGSIPRAVSEIDRAAVLARVRIVHFCEWFGFGRSKMPWPESCCQEIESDARLAKNCAPGAHALYSTSMEIMRAAHAWCKKNGRIFSFHLAESQEENRQLEYGDGPLREIYSKNILPHGWKEPRLKAASLARKLGLLDSATLCVHGTQLENAEIRELSESGAALCLCPRSNKNLVGQLPPVQKLIDSGMRLCLGTDGLTSSPDLDVRNEALFLRENLDIPFTALARMLTVNGTDALGVATCSLLPGAPAMFSVMPGHFGDV